MDLKALIAQIREKINGLLEERKTVQDELVAMRQLETPDVDKVRELGDKKAGIDAQLEEARAELDMREKELAADEAAAALTARVLPQQSRETAPARVGQEARTYRPDTDPRGKQFLLDVARQQILNDPVAGQRLARHMVEEQVERSAAIAKAAGLQERAIGTAAVSGLVVPQYLVEMFAPHAKAGRPFADFCRKHDLPDEGMTVNIGKGTTGTSTAVQTEGSAVSETNYDDTLISPAVQTNAGQQTMSRQSIERSAGAEDTVLEDLFRSYGTTLDSTLLNQATNGLTNVATSIAYTDASPTAAEAYPKLLAANAAVEGALLDMDPGDAVAVMHSRRWYWLQSQLSSSFPLIGQPGVAAQLIGQNAGERYGSGLRGVLPNGTPVIVDNNIATNLGGGTEDEIYYVAQSEAHLWEDPDAPVFIRAEQTLAANLQVLLVIYGYFAYTFVRRAHAQKIAGTGLIAPTF